MFDVFAGMGKARIEAVFLRSLANPDGTYTAREGDYLLTLTRLEQFETQRDGQPRITAEFVVDQVLRSTPASHKVGQAVKEMWALDVTPKGLTDRGAAEMTRVVSFFRAIFSQAGIEVTSENIGSLAKAATEATMANTDQSIVGMQVVCSIYKSKPSARTGKVYDEQKFSAPPTPAA